MQKPKRNMMRHEPQTKKQKKGCVVMKEDPKRRALLLAKAKLHEALLCVYLQSNDTVVSLKPSNSGLAMKEHYAPVEDEVRKLSKGGVFVLGHMVQGVAKPWPKQQKQQQEPSSAYSTESDAEEEEEVSHSELEAAFVRTNWIFSHLLFRSEGDERKYNAPHIKKGVALVERASETMERIAGKVKASALALAGMMGLEPESEAEALAKLRPEHALPEEEEAVSPFRMLPSDFRLWIEGKHKALITAEEESEARLAFKNTVMEVFGFRVCNSGPGWMDREDAVIGSTGLHKPYEAMTDEERVLSGTVKMGDLIEDLLVDDSERVLRAINGALVACRGLLTASRMLKEACAKFVAVGCE